MRDSPDINIKEEEKLEPESSSFDPLQKERERRKLIKKYKFQDQGELEISLSSEKKSVSADEEVFDPFAFELPMVD